MRYDDLTPGTHVSWRVWDGSITTATVESVGASYGRAVVVVARDGVRDVITDTRWTTIEDTIGHWTAL